MKSASPVKPTSAIADLLWRHPTLARKALCRHYPLDQALLTEFKWALDWSALSRNGRLPWSPTLLHEFRDCWDWSCLCSGDGGLRWYANWTEDLLHLAATQAGWSQLSNMRWPAFPWSQELIARHSPELDWRRLSLHHHLPWSAELLSAFEGQWNWSLLSLNTALPWSVELIQRFESRWDWRLISGNTGIPFDDRDLRQYLEPRLDLAALCGNWAVTWDEAEIRHYFLQQRALDWQALWANESLVWSESLDVDLDFQREIDPCALCCNPSVPWSFEFANDRVGWLHPEELASNSGVLWSHELIELIQRYAPHPPLDFSEISCACSEESLRWMIRERPEDVDWSAVSRRSSWTWDFVWEHQNKLELLPICDTFDFRITTLSRHQARQLLLHCAATLSPKRMMTAEEGGLSA